MEVNPSRSCRNAEFSKGGGGGVQAQHLKLPQEATVVVERTPTPLPGLHSTKDLLAELRPTCLRCAWRHRKEWNRDELLRGLSKLVEEFAGEVLALDDEE
ncbi:hypothetical protein M378DRAFT_167726 [Amanita muscaria Koide BX008]|uniref:Uncharacterized protein n=1 Tax=Amanita muscaria (strain Koide BX008) TaxID=946122 RepID=A0A0C2WGZ9_AMAMK|nr:hypothetical protein M378DRAFT_167726 [Amanita muscaria Koide BX008]